MQFSYSQELLCKIIDSSPNTTRIARCSLLPFDFTSGRCRALPLLPPCPNRVISAAWHSVSAADEPLLPFSCWIRCRSWVVCRRATHFAGVVIDRVVLPSTCLASRPPIPESTFSSLSSLTLVLSALAGWW